LNSSVDLDSSTHETGRTPGPSAPARRPDRVRMLLRGLGQTLITIGLVALLFVVYQLFLTNLFTAQHQHHLAQQIEQQWQDHPTVTAPQPATTAGAAPALPAIKVAVGQPFAKVHIPRLAGDWVVVEGVSQKQLAQGPGHYIGTAMPGEQGNFSVAGHAISSVFLDLADLRPGDPIVVETQDYWFVYRVLGDPATGNVLSDPSGIPGREIVLPTGVQVISPTPDQAANAPATGAYLTLTTCTPATTATHRLIVHARLDGQPISKASMPTGPPALDGR
jgi:sortase A